MSTESRDPIEPLNELEYPEGDVPDFGILAENAVIAFQNGAVAFGSPYEAVAVKFRTLFVRTLQLAKAKPGEIDQLIEAAQNLD